MPVSDAAVQNLNRRYPDCTEDVIRDALRKTKGHAGKAVIYLASKTASKTDGQGTFTNRVSAPFASTPKTRKQLLDPFGSPSPRKPQQRAAEGGGLFNLLTKRPPSEATHEFANDGNEEEKELPPEPTDADEEKKEASPVVLTKKPPSSSAPHFQSAGKTRPLQSFLPVSPAGKSKVVSSSPSNDNKKAMRRKSAARLEAARKVTESGTLFKAKVGKVASKTTAVRTLTPPRSSGGGAPVGVLQRGTKVTMKLSSIESDWANCPAGSNRLVFQKGDEFTVKKVTGRFFVGREQENFRANTMGGGMTQFWAPLASVENGEGYLKAAAIAEAGRSVLQKSIA